LRLARSMGTSPASSIIWSSPARCQNSLTPIPHARSG